MSQFWKAILLVLIGFVLSGLIGVSSLCMAGAGHGWNSSVISALCVFALPLTGFGFVFHSGKAAWAICAYVTLACLGLDFALAIATISEGTQYLAAVLQHVPGFFALWGDVPPGPIEE